MGMILMLIPDLSIAVTRWRANGDTVFVEARNSATLAGENGVQFLPVMVLKCVAIWRGNSDLSPSV
jgi:hypothetical protein